MAGARHIDAPRRLAAQQRPRPIGIRRRRGGGVLLGHDQQRRHRHPTERTVAHRSGVRLETDHRSHTIVGRHATRAGRRGQRRVGAVRVTGESDPVVVDRLDQLSGQHGSARLQFGEQRVCIADPVDLVRAIVDVAAEQPVGEAVARVIGRHHDRTASGERLAQQRVGEPHPRAPVREHDQRKRSRRGQRLVLRCSRHERDTGEQFVLRSRPVAHGRRVPHVDAEQPAITLRIGHQRRSAPDRVAGWLDRRSSRELGHPSSLRTTHASRGCRDRSAQSTGGGGVTGSSRSSLRNGR